MKTTYIVDTINRRLYAGNNFYMATEYFKWACANGFTMVELKETEDGCYYKSVKIFCK